jgi:hypothetical protein
MSALATAEVVEAEGVLGDVRGPPFSTEVVLGDPRVSLLVTLASAVAVVAKAEGVLGELPAFSWLPLPPWAGDWEGQGIT